MSESRSDTNRVDDVPTVPSPEERAIAELPKVFDGPDEARALAIRSGFPRDQLPPFNTNAQVFWEKVVFAARSGVVVGGVGALLEAAAKLRPENGTLSLFSSSSCVAPSEERLLLSRKTPQISGRPAALQQFLWVTSVTMLLLSAFFYFDSKDSSRSALTVSACQVRIEGAREIGRGWVMYLDSEEIHEISIGDGNTIVFKCPPDGCDVAVVVDLHNGEIRHWIIEPDPDRPPEVSLLISEKGAPRVFVRASVEQGILDESRFISASSPLAKPLDVARPYGTGRLGSHENAGEFSSTGLSSNDLTGEAGEFTDSETSANSSTGTTIEESSTGTRPTRDTALARKLVAQAQAAVVAGNRQQAEVLFGEALEADSHNVDALVGLGKIAFNQAHYSTSVKRLERAVKFGKRRSDLWLLLGDAYFKNVRYAKARYAYRKALDLGNGDAAARLSKVEKKIANGG